MNSKPLYVHFTMFGKPAAPSRESSALGITPRTSFLTASFWGGYFEPEVGMRKLDMPVPEMADLLNEDYLILSTNHGSEVHAIRHADISSVHHHFYETSRGDTVVIGLREHIVRLYATPKELLPQLQKQGFEITEIESWKSPVGALEGAYNLVKFQPL